MEIICLILSRCYSVSFSISLLSFPFETMCISVDRCQQISESVGSSVYADGRVERDAVVEHSFDASSSVPARDPILVSRTQELVHSVG